MRIGDMNKMKHLLLKKGIKLVCIAVEGGDCIGKGTFSKSLHNYLVSRVSKLNTDKRTFLQPIFLSFPDYNEPMSGDTIKAYLKTEKLNQYILNGFMSDNRYNVFYKLMTDLLGSDDVDYNPNVEEGHDAIQLVICDRSVFSAMTYTMAKSIAHNYRVKDTKDKEEFKKIYIDYLANDLDFTLSLCNSGLDLTITTTNEFKLYDKLRKKYNADTFDRVVGTRYNLYEVASTFNADFMEGIPTPDFLIQVNEDFSDPRSREAHKFTQDARAEERGKDSNENDEELQNDVTKIYYEFRNMYEDIIKTTSLFDLGAKRDIFIPFGTNFGNTDYEEKVFKLLKKASFDTVELEVKDNGSSILDDYPF